jgi:glycosyltransferase involved in cell wall biosynthesis
MNKISLILPVYNAGPYLRESLESIFTQTLPPHEVIAINDGSTDNSLEILNEFSSRLLIFSRENRGLSYTLNQGIAQAKGNLITFLDADDLWLPNKLEKQVEFLTANPDKAACFGMVKQFISPDLPDDVKNTISCPDEIQRGILKITLMIRREALDVIGFFDEEVRRGDFVDWFARAEDLGISYDVLPDLVALRRLHRSSLSSQQQHEKDLIRIAKATLDRRRNAAKAQVSLIQFQPM